jgi:hypothetical protein
MAISDSGFTNAVYTRLAGQTPCLQSATTACCKGGWQAFERVTAGSAGTRQFWRAGLGRGSDFDPSAALETQGGRRQILGL